MKRQKLSEPELVSQLKTISGWEIIAGKLHREFVFHDFSEAFAWMTKLAMLSEKLDHHPSWTNVFNRVAVDLWTHDVGGITELDIRWAKTADSSF